MQKAKPKNITLIRIFRLIKENKLTAKDFAQQCSLSPGNLTDWKTGRSKPSIDSLKKISKVYGVQLDWLTGDTIYRTKEEEFNALKQRESQLNTTN